MDIEQEIFKAAMDISEDTKKAIDNAAEEINRKQEQKIEDKLQKEQAKTEFEDNLQKCYELLDSATSHNPVLGDTLLEMAGADNLSGLMLRLRNAMKKQNITKKVSKKKYIGKTAYYLK